jgi:hypothetical protein
MICYFQLDSSPKNPIACRNIIDSVLRLEMHLREFILSSLGLLEGAIESNHVLLIVGQILILGTSWLGL